MSDLSVIPAPFLSPGVSLLHRGVSIRFLQQQLQHPQLWAFLTYGFIISVLRSCPLFPQLFCPSFIFSIDLGYLWRRAHKGRVPSAPAWRPKPAGCGICCAEGNPMAQPFPVQAVLGTRVPWALTVELLSAVSLLPPQSLLTGEIMDGTRFWGLA